MPGIKPQSIEPEAQFDTPLTIPKVSVKRQVYLKKPNVRAIAYVFFSVVIILFGILVAVNISKQTHDSQSKAAPSGPTLALAPATIQKKIGETFVLGLQMNTNTDIVSAVEVLLTYDATAVQILSFTPGISFPVVLVPESHSNGVVKVVLGSAPTSPFKGATVIGSWNIKVLTARNSNIAITNATQVAAIGKNANVLVSSTGTTITASNPVTVTASPSITVTSSPTVTTPVTTSPTVTVTGSTTNTPSPTGSFAPSDTPTETATPEITPAAEVTPTSTPNIIQKIWNGIFGPKPTPTPMSTPEPAVPSDEEENVTATPQLVAPAEEEPKPKNIFAQFWDGVVNFFSSLFKKK